MVGTLRIANSSVVSGLSSMSILPTAALPSYAAAIFSMIGPNDLHGPHHAAPKSTTTSWLFANISLKLASVMCNAIVFIFYSGI